MTKREAYTTHHDVFEYHGGTTIQVIRQQADQTVWQDWLIFDTVEAAMEYFNDCCSAA